jgi:hypothetical protein
MARLGRTIRRTPTRRVIPKRDTWEEEPNEGVKKARQKSRSWRKQRQPK